MKPFSQASENNKQPILEVLVDCFAKSSTILEIGSGTGQHAAYFARNLPHLHWIASDQEVNHPGIRQWISHADRDNLSGPVTLDVTRSDDWSKLPEADYDGVFSANTAHIMSWSSVIDMFSGVGQLLPAKSPFVLYGPFNRNGEFTSPSNRAFDASLRAGARHMGIRDDQEIFSLAEQNRLATVDDVEMPANNRILIFRKIT